MKSDFYRRAPAETQTIILADLHPDRCTGCPECEAHAAPAGFTGADQVIALQILAGFAVGLALCLIADLVTGSSNVLAMFGWR